MVGIGFPERNDSFDFVAGLEDFKKQLRVATGIPAKDSVALGPSKDFSLKEGEKISISIPGLAGPVKKSTDAPLLGEGGGGLKKLAPPPKKGGTTSVTTSSSSQLSDLDF